MRHHDRATRSFVSTLAVLAALAAVLALSACATTKDRGNALREAQYAWSAAIRWGDIEGAWTMVDPEYRETHPMTDLAFERYKQVGITAYRDHGASVGEGTATRQIELGVVNRHTQQARQARYVERWRYDAESGTWWITSGLPDLWQD